jgi:hypothetical protein
MVEEEPKPEKVKESEEENAEPAVPVQLALAGGGHRAEGKCGADGVGAGVRDTLRPAVWLQRAFVAGAQMVSLRRKHSKGVAQSAHGATVTSPAQSKALQVALFAHLVWQASMVGVSPDRQTPRSCERPPDTAFSFTISHVRVEFGVSMANSRAFWAHAGPERAVIIREARIGCLVLPALLTELFPLL